MHVLLLAVSQPGCGRPRGELFTPIDPPVVWPQPPEPARIRFIGAIADSRDLHAAVSGSEQFRAFFRGDRPPIRLSGPHGADVNGNRLLAIADASGSAVHVVDLHAREHRIISGWRDQRFQTPVAVAWIGNRLYVTDAGRGEIVALQSDGTVVRQFGSGDLVRPVGIAYAPSREMLYVVDGGEHRIAVFYPDGSLHGFIGSRGAAPGQFNYPSHVCCDGERLAVADSGNFRVQLLDLDGRCLRTIGQKGDAAGDFSLPKGVAFDGDGHLYVVDAQFENVQIFNDRGQLLLAFGSEGTGRGEFWLPAGIAIDSRDWIWVADAGNRRVQVFEYLKVPS